MHIEKSSILFYGYVLVDQYALRSEMKSEEEMTCAPGLC